MIARIREMYVMAIIYICAYAPCLQCLSTTKCNIFTSRPYHVREGSSSCVSSSRLMEKSSNNVGDDETAMLKLIERAKEVDAEWLKTVFGESIDELLSTSTSSTTSSSSPSKTRSMDSSSISSKQTVGVKTKQDKKPVSDSDEFDASNGSRRGRKITGTNSSAGSNSGTSKDESSSSRKDSDDSDSDDSDSDEADMLFSLGYSFDDLIRIKPAVRGIILEKGVRRPRQQLPREWLINSNPSAKTRQAPADRSRNKQQPAIPSSKSSPNNRSKRSVDDEGEGEAFKWSKEGSRRVDGDDIEFNGNDMSSLSDASYDNPVTFWPDKKEFKGMLLDESRWRVGLFGDWSAPLVRFEAKWRYNLYKNWLSLLESGLGDGYDVVPDSFSNRDDDYNDNFVGNDDESGDNNVLKSRNRRDRSLKSPSNNAANSYERWLGSQTNGAEWTDMEYEQKESLDDVYDAQELESNIFQSTVGKPPSMDWFDDNDADDADSADAYVKNDTNGSSRLQDDIRKDKYRYDDDEY